MKEFSDDFIKTLPEPTSYSDVFWDTVCPRLCVIKAKRGIQYRMKLTKKDRQVLGLTCGTLYTIGRDMPVDEVRAKYREIEDKIKKGEPVITDAAGRLLDTSAMETERSYETLMSILMDAFEQASSGKGNARHGSARPFEEQDMQRIIRATSIDFALGQAIKKLLESRTVRKREHKRAELLGAIVYTAGAIVALDASSSNEDEEPEQKEEANDNS